jgi:4-alpha-glucanotransferase
MIYPRCSGILLHITSLPAPYGIGDLGDSAHQFVDFLAAAGQKIWQVLPVSPTGYGDSPYQCFSAFAGNPLFIDLLTLQEKGQLGAEDFAVVPQFPNDFVEYGGTTAFKKTLLRKAAQHFFINTTEENSRAYETFCRSNATWLDDYALFMAGKDFHRGSVWTDWEPGLRERDPNAMEHWREKLSPEIKIHKFAQFEFFRQWQRLRDSCQQRGIRIMGDIPIYVAHDSADVWTHPELFRLDKQGRPTVVAGVPPDYFSATGQLWGNPLYRWDALERSGYRWWIDRFRASFKLFDLVRLDHFRGFEAYWEVPAEAPTAMDGKWVKAPGKALFKVLQRELGELPAVAENLGVITPEVESIRREFGFLGMSLLQFAFGNDPQGPSFRPHNYSRELAAYTGGHDNDTTVGWWTSTGVGESTRTAEDIRKEREFAKAYLGFENEPVNWVFIRSVLASVATIAIIPLQDVLGLGSEARMNLPGTVSGNWKWRYRAGTLTAEIENRMKQMTVFYDR